MQVVIKKRKNIQNSLQKGDFSEKLQKQIQKEKLYSEKKGTYLITLPPEECQIPCYNSSFPILYEDEYLLIVFKKGNLDCLSSKRHYDNNLSSMICYYYQKNNIQSTIHFVNRLDYKTEGIVVLAKHGYIHHLLMQQKIRKEYQLICHGHLKKKRGWIQIKIKKEENSVKRIVHQDGKMAITQYKLIKQIGNDSLVWVRLHTGRTHQIRLSFATLGHPLYHDHLYGNGSKEKPLALCANFIKFIHPITKKRIRIKIQPSFKI